MKKCTKNEPCFISTNNGCADCAYFIDDGKDYNPVTRPEHYANGKIECITAMEMVFGEEAVMWFALLNTFKYLWRRESKGNAEQDVDKALWYFDKAKKLMGDVYETGRSDSEN